MNSELDITFEKAVNYVQKGPPIKNITNEVKLKFYGLFKQATVGPCNETAPNRLRVVQRMKWDAWNKLDDISKEEAKKRYIEQLEEIVPDWEKPKSKL